MLSLVGGWVTAHQQVKQSYIEGKFFSAKIRRGVLQAVCASCPILPRASEHISAQYIQRLFGQWRCAVKGRPVQLVSESWDQQNLFTVTAFNRPQLLDVASIASLKKTILLVRPTPKDCKQQRVENVDVRPPSWCSLMTHNWDCVALQTSRWSHLKFPPHFVPGVWRGSFVPLAQGVSIGCTPSQNGQPDLKDFQLVES